MTTKHNKIEIINKTNLKCDILWIFIINSSNCVVLLFVNTDFGRLVGVVTNWIDSKKKKKLKYNKNLINIYC